MGSSIHVVPGIGISTHILDTSAGVAAADVPVTLEFADPFGENWQKHRDARTNLDGRASLAEPADGLKPGRYRLTFDTAAYWADQGTDVSGIWTPSVVVIVQIDDPNRHYHLPLLLSPFGYTTYRGT